MKHSFLLTIFAIGSLLSTSLSVHAAEETNGDSWLRDSWAQSSATRQKISDLPNTAVYAVPMPILFGVGLKDISPNFGDPRAGGRSHEGEDIMATKGTPIVSPTDAVVLRTGDGPSEGLYVYTANPGGETFVYMHLDRIGEGVDKGDVLEKGDLIGYVGNTGNASGGAAHLHFEIHDNNGNPTDPFPRITTEFSIAEKIIHTNTILAQSNDPLSLAQFLVDTFRSTFVSAKASGITLPQSITDILGTINLPGITLSQGSSGNDVRTLQNYLIESNTGLAAQSLAGTGATGYFGALTKSALIEYQKSAGISPANGVYDATTRARLTTVISTPSQTTTEAPTVSTEPLPAYTFIRNMGKNMNGEDVKMLQKILNANGYSVAATGPGSSGNETTYFGAATVAAVKNFQAAQGISPISGYVGPLTRTALTGLVKK
ncbi:MAG TPA: peptidoglycan-binding protein [Candidatus Magasanikbacteria bacterium]|nr:peptidoglycan-binding protein [Candidatus Magasanikbacteria bacterium]